MYKKCRICTARMKKNYISVKDEKYIPDICDVVCLESFLRFVVGKFKKVDENREIFKHNTTARSSYEEVFMAWLKKKNITFKYEPFVFQVLKNKLYVPDFYLPDTQVFIEVKGQWFPGAFQKFKFFARLSGYKIFLLHEHYIKMMKKDLK